MANDLQVKFKQSGGAEKFSIAEQNGAGITSVSGFSSSLLEQPQILGFRQERPTRAGRTGQIVLPSVERPA